MDKKNNGDNNNNNGNSNGNVRIAPPLVPQPANNGGPGPQAQAAAQVQPVPQFNPDDPAVKAYFRDLAYNGNVREITERLRHHRTQADIFDLQQYPYIQQLQLPLIHRVPAEQADYLATFPPEWQVNYAPHPPAGWGPQLGAPDIHVGRGQMLQDMDQVDFPRDAPMDGKTLWFRKKAITEYFQARDPDTQYVKTLGVGGLGIASRVRFTDPNDRSKTRDVVVKTAKGKWPDMDLREEGRQMLKHHRSRHAVQRVLPEEVGLPTRPPWQKQPESDDSSSGEEESSADDDFPTFRPPRKRRKLFTKADIAKKSKYWDVDKIERKGFVRIDRHDKDYLLIEYLQNGDVLGLIQNCLKEDEYIPNRILWELWICLIKQCIAMAFPPRKFHPDRKKTTGDLDEIIPPVPQQLRMKRTVHFDIDPQNMLLADDDPNDSEHIAPRIKVSDFGLMQQIKPQKRDIYYQYRRLRGKVRYMAPEQFTQEWDFVPPDRNGSFVCDEPVAGNYGSHTNVWQVAWTMWSLITLSFPPMPPFPAMFEARPDRGPCRDMVSYGMNLIDAQWDWVDLDLRKMVAQCLCHDPADRPSLTELLENAEGNLKRVREKADRDIRRGTIDENGHQVWTDFWARAWVHSIIYDAPIYMSDPEEVALPESEGELNGVPAAVPASGSQSGTSGQPTLSEVHSAITPDPYNYNQSARSLPMYSFSASKLPFAAPASFALRSRRSLPDEGRLSSLEDRITRLDI